MDERIELDAVIEDVINCCAFYARLRNGHRFVAFVRRRSDAAEWRVGDRVRVMFSPFDFSKGEVLDRWPREDQTP